MSLCIDNIHVTGLETYHVSSFIERVQNEAANPCYWNSHLTGVKTLLPLYVRYSFYIGKIEATVVGPYWRNLGVYENVKYVDEKHVSHFT